MTYPPRRQQNQIGNSTRAISRVFLAAPLLYGLCALLCLSPCCPVAHNSLSLFLFLVATRQRSSSSDDQHSLLNLLLSGQRYAYFVEGESVGKSSTLQQPKRKEKTKQKLALGKRFNHATFIQTPKTTVVQKTTTQESENDYSMPTILNGTNCCRKSFVRVLGAAPKNNTLPRRDRVNI